MVDAIDRDQDKPGRLDSPVTIPINDDEDNTLFGDIPTFDASDLDHHLEKTNTQRMVGKWLIALVSYNPLPLIRLALIQAHTNTNPQNGPDHDRQLRGSAFDINDNNNSHDVWDVEIQQHSLDDDDPFQKTAKTPSKETRLVVDDLCPSIQQAFRQSVLQAVVGYVCACTAIVTTCLLCIPWDSLQQVVQQSPYLLPVVETSSWVVTVLLMALLYTLRFNTPTNFVVLAFLTLSEIVCIVLSSITRDPHVAIQGMALFSCGLILFRAFACQLRTCQTIGEPLELLRPEQAVLRSIAVLALVAVPLNLVVGSDITHMTTAFVAVLLCLVLAGMVWVALVVSVLMQTMKPEDHTSSLLFFQADLVVICVVWLGQEIRKYLRQCVRLVQRYRATTGRAETTAAQGTVPAVNAVVPVTRRDEGQAAETSRESKPTTPLYPAHMIPRKSASPRHRISVSD